MFGAGSKIFMRAEYMFTHSSNFAASPEQTSALNLFFELVTPLKAANLRTGGFFVSLEQ
jgi:hypothetical protein